MVGSFLNGRGQLVLNRFFSKLKSRQHEKRLRRRVLVAGQYEQLERREVLTSLAGVDGPTDSTGNPLATIYLNPETKQLFIHSNIQNPNLPGWASDVIVSVDSADGDIVVNQVEGSAGLFRDIPGFTPETFHVNTRTFNAGSIDQIIYRGSEGNDRFQNRTQIDSRIAGLGGDDYLVGGGGKDRVIGNEGDDRLFGGRNDDVLIGGNGDDQLSEDRANDNGNDRLIGGAGDDRLAGGVGDDFVMGGNGRDVIGLRVGQSTTGSLGPSDGLEITEAGNDRLVGNAGDDIIYGGDGSDEIYGGAGDDVLYGGELQSENSQAFVVGVQDTIAGGDGNDTIVAGNSSLLAFGGLGNDSITGSTGQDRLIGHAGDDSVFGLAGDDFISGGNGSDALFGNAGSDRISGGEGDDQLHGGSGADRIFAALHADGGLAEFGRDQIFGDAELDFILRDLSDTLAGDDHQLS